MDLTRKYANKKLEAKRQKILAEKEQARILVAKKPRFGQTRQIIEDAYEMYGKSPSQPPTFTHDTSGFGIPSLFRSFPPGCVKNREDFYRLLVLAEEETDLFESGRVTASNFARSLADLARWSEFWVRDPSTWKCRTHNIWRQFATLTRHLLCKYDVPAFMDSAWLHEGNRGENDWDRKRFQEWYIHIGSGQNIRTAYGLPMPMTKKIAHYFLDAPSDYGIMNAFRYGHIRSLGGHEYIARCVNATFLGTDFRNNEFWESVFRFFIENPMMPHDQIGPIIDYANNQRYVNRIEIINGETINHGPAQPGFCMKGRTPEAILDQVDKWHNQLARSKKYASINWKPCKFSSMEFTEGSERNKKVYSIVELLSTAALREEGRLMHHCVATYAGGCACGRDAIFTLGYTQHGSYNKMVTIRVSPGYSKIEEVRGNYNAKPDVVSARIVRAWAQQVGLSFSSWALL